MKIQVVLVRLILLLVLIAPTIVACDSGATGGKEVLGTINAAAKAKREKKEDTALQGK